MLSAIDVWALPLNTGLLIILALINTYIARKQREEKKDIVDLKRSFGINRRWVDGDHGGNDEHRQDTGERRRATDKNRKEMP